MAYNSDKFDWRVLNLVNEERAKVGADPLKIDQQLDRAADIHSQDQADMGKMTHNGSDGSQPWDRVDATGYDWSYVGENVAAGYDSPESVVAGWMNSQGHRENILNPEFEEMGVGYANSGNGTPYWTQVFAADFG